MGDDTTETIDQAIGQRVEGLRQAKGWSQQDLADAVAAHGGRLHQTTIMRTEKGERRLTVAELVLLARALGIPTVDLLSPGEEPPEPADVIEQAREKRDQAKRRAAEAEARVTLWREEVDRAKFGIPKMGNSEHHFELVEAAKEAERRLDDAREELVRARVDLEEARDELELLTEPLALRMIRLTADGYPLRGER